MFDSGIHCVTALVFAAVVLLCLVRKLSIRSSEDSGTSGWFDKLIESKAGIAAQVLSFLMLVVSIGSLTGVVIWEVVQAMTGTVKAPLEIFVAAIVGAAASTIGFALFALTLSLFGPILFVVYEEWTAYVAPAIGGTVGAAISGGLAVSVIYIVPLSALTGGITLLFYGTITAKKRITFNGMTELVKAGVGFGAVNGVIVAAVFKVLDVTVGTGWLLA